MKAKEVGGFKTKGLVLMEVAAANMAPSAQPLADLAAVSAAANAAEPTAAAAQPPRNNHYYMMISTMRKTLIC